MIRFDAHAVRRSRLLAGSTLFLVAAVIAAASSEATAGRRWDAKEAGPRSNGGPGDLAVSQVEVFELSASGASKRHLVRALVENRAAVALSAAWRLEFTNESGAALGECIGESLQEERVAVCEAWLPGGVVGEGDLLLARLDRDYEPYDAWDGEPTNDERTVRVRTVPTGGQVLRVASFDVQPRVLHGFGDAQFRFTVEGGHLAWLLVDGQAPRLLAGHPADGIVSGSGTARIEKSGPVTLVARNSLGAFVYVTIPVLNTFDEHVETWGIEEEPEAAPDSPGLATVLPIGVYDVDENLAVLEQLAGHLSERDWASTLDELRRAADRRRESPRPASALNPEGQRDRR